MEHHFLMMWCLWQWHYMMPMASLVGPLHSLGQDYWDEVQNEFLAMWQHWCWHWNHMMPMMSSMAQLHFLGQDNQIEMQHDFFSYVILLVLASHDTYGIVTGMWHWCQHWYSHWCQRLYNTSENHLKITNAMVLLMAPSANHVIAMYMTKTNMSLNATYEPHMPISLCPHMTLLC